MRGSAAESSARPGLGGRRAYVSELDVGDPVRVGETMITPVAVVRGLRLANWGVAARYPSEVIVERRGKVERLPIRDVTLIVLAALAGLTVLFQVLARLWLANGGKRHG